MALINLVRALINIETNGLDLGRDVVGFQVLGSCAEALPCPRGTLALTRPSGASRYSCDVDRPLWEGYHDSQGTPTRSHISPGILVYEDDIPEGRRRRVRDSRTLLEGAALPAVSRPSPTGVPHS